jgi:2-dehydro-3-deoxygluconokinase
MVDWERVFEGYDWFHFTGITPALSQGAADACMEAAVAARKKGMTVSVDLNYRKNLWKYGKPATEVMPTLADQCDVIVGNEEDAQKSLGIAPPGVDVRDGHVEASSYRIVSEQVMQRFPRCRKLAFTLRGSISASHNTWSGVLFQGKHMHTARSYEINPIIDRIGAGDAFAAGLIYGLMTWKDDDTQALSFAVAASCLKHSVPGDFNRVTVAEVMTLMKGDGSGRVAR